MSPQEQHSFVDILHPPISSNDFPIMCRVLYEGKERLMAGCDIVLYTATGKEANVNNSGGSRTFILIGERHKKWLILL